MRVQSLYVMALALLCVVITSLGNACSRNNYSRGPASDLSMESGATKQAPIGFVQDGGQTYDGKVFRSLLPEGSRCGDGLVVRTQIEFSRTGQALLTRQDCTKLNRAKMLDKADLGFPPGLPLTLIYQGETLTEFKSPAESDDDDDESANTIDCVTPFIRLKISSQNAGNESVRAEYKNRTPFFRSEMELMGTADPALVSSALPADLVLQNNSTRIDARIYNSVNILGSSLRAQLVITNKNSGQTSESTAFCSWED